LPTWDSPGVAQPGCVDGELGRVAAAQGGFVYRWQALDLNVSEQQIAALVRHKKWVRLRRGAYATRETVQKLNPSERHVLVLRAGMGNLSGRVVATGHSALAVYGVPLWGVTLSDLHVHREATRSSRREAGISHRRGAIDDEEIRSVRGLLVASPERAVVDACREVGFEAGVVLADGARRLLDLDLSAALAIVERQRDWPYSSRPSTALRFSDPRAATVGESRARVLLARLGVPKPDLQRQIRDARTRTLVGVTDLYVDEFATAVEFDGKLKYGRALYEQSGSLEDVDLGDVVWREKRREDAIRDEGHEVVRLVWSELDGQDRMVAARFERAFARARRILAIP
jgi:hypothetical protein